jgi:hypothetical protein
MQEVTKNTLQKNKKNERNLFMKTYALINHDSGEVYTLTANTCHTLYKRALSHRRFCIYCESRQDKLTLLSCDSVESTSNATIWRNATTLQVWEGGDDTPIIDLGISMPLYYRLHYKGIRTVSDLAEYARGIAIFSHLPKKLIREIIDILQPYNKEAAMTLTRHYNERHYKRGE